MTGLKIAALYSLKPLELGYCGPQDKSATEYLLNYLLDRGVQEVLEKRAREILAGFEAAYPYYKLIARRNGVKDPFDERVVKAYWVGNELLDNVSTYSLQHLIAEEFSMPAGPLPPGIAQRKAKEIPLGSKPHHTFHVLFLGSITGRVVLKGEFFDCCRISWGRVTKKDPSHNSVTVSYQPLVTEGNYQLGNPQEKDVNWNKDLIPQLKIGQVVSFHWKQAVQILTQEDIENIQKYTQRTLESINAVLSAKSR